MLLTGAFHLFQLLVALGSEDPFTFQHSVRCLVSALVPPFSVKLVAVLEPLPVDLQ